MVGKTIYVTTATATYAVDARDGTFLWSHKLTLKSLGLAHRSGGVAYARGRLYRGTPDARVICLDAKTG